MAKKGRVALRTVELEIGGKIIRLTMDQAKELKDILNDTFGEERVIYRDWYVRDYPWHDIPLYPITTCAIGKSITSDSVALNASEHWNVYSTSGTLQLKAA